MAGPKEYSFDQSIAIENLYKYFDQNTKKNSIFGSTVNQTFEAYAIMKIMEKYKSQGWIAELKNPKKGDNKGVFKLKFSTRGAPNNYSYFELSKGYKRIQIRHQLRVMTAWTLRKYAPNIVCDIALINDSNLDHYDTDTPIPNSKLITFCECKHMSAFSELIAGFLGMVHELQPFRLLKMKKQKRFQNHIKPFLYISGGLYKSAQQMRFSIIQRKLDLKVIAIDEEI